MLVFYPKYKLPDLYELTARLPFLFLYHQPDPLHESSPYHAAILVALSFQTGLEVPAACAAFRVSP
jgi:hypothetical protein